jgi:hypothetical protein
VSRFDREFQNTPDTPGGINALLARMEARGATQDDMHELRARLMGNKFSYLVSSAMVARAANARERALCRCFYGLSLGTCFDDDNPPDWLMSEYQNIIREALEQGLDKDSKSQTPLASVINNLGIEFARRNQLDQAWRLFTRHMEVVEQSDCTVTVYLANMASAITYKLSSPSMSQDVRTDIRKYLNRVASESNHSVGFYDACKQLGNSLNKTSKGGDLDKHGKP